MGLDRYIGSAADVTLRGGAYHAVQVAFRLVNELSRGFAIALAIITALMCVLLRSFRFGVLSMVPKVLPVAFVLGMLAILDIRWAFPRSFWH